MKKPKLAFISPVFLFPNDAGGKIRTTNILRGMKGGAFEITLIGPALETQVATWAESLDQVSDHFVRWQPAPNRPRWQRAVALLDQLPVNVCADNTPAARTCIENSLCDEEFDLVIFDFVHAAVLAPPKLGSASICFTHNVEAEIFGRHAQQASNPVMRGIWRSQYRKMQKFERATLGNFTSVIAVSPRDAEIMRENYSLTDVSSIPTGVDLDFFAWSLPPEIDQNHPPTVVFTGSMNWDANIDGVTYFLESVWPLVLQKMPDARFVVVGRDAPTSLIDRAKHLKNVRFTGFVDDVRPYVHDAQVFVIPLRVGGGTRIKAFEAMALGCPVVSTKIGIEGLDVTAGQHYLLCDTPEEQASGITKLFHDNALRADISRSARECVENRFSHRVAAEAFEQICLRTLEKHRALV